ncbi:BTAD domain-containing putative transcriptional regulator [Amycolatopsis coloradensis]
MHRALRATLVEELGVEPGAEVRRVHAAVLSRRTDRQSSHGRK